jgi:hypothetical protein
MPELPQAMKLEFQNVLELLVPSATMMRSKVG